jgi:hypothetical protein
MEGTDDDQPQRARRRWPATVLFLLVVAVTALAFRQGLITPRFNPLPDLNLSEPNPWFIDWRLAAIKNSPEVCARTLQSPHIEAREIPDGPIKEGCGWTNSVRLVSAGGVRASFDKLTCESAVALALWLEHDVQPAAQRLLGQRVVAIRSFGSYACRNIVGNPLWKHFRSQHATANAADIAGFVLANGRQISVERQWHGDGPETKFLHAVHDGACRYFRAVIGPDYNAAHHNHFHLDRGPYPVCR